MKFTVELEDFWLEEEELSSALESFIKGDIARQINEQIKSRVAALVDKIIKDEVETKLETRVQTLVNEISATHKIKGRYSSDSEMSISEYIQSVFNQVELSKKGNAIIEDAVKKHVNANSQALTTELKNRYDMLFASQIVNRLNEAGMLKAEVANILLQDGKNS